MARDPLRRRMTHTLLTYMNSRGSIDDALTGIRKVRLVLVTLVALEDVEKRRKASGLSPPNSYCPSPHSLSLPPPCPLHL